jgi:hypothetical protein
MLARMQEFWQRGGRFVVFGRRFVSMLLTFAFLSLDTAYARSETLSLKWAELGPAVTNKEVRLVLRDHTQLEGKVVGVQSSTLSMKIVETSDKKAYPPGQASIARVEISEIRVTRVKGPMRLIGAAGVGAAGSLLYLGPTLDDSRPSNDTARMLGWIAVTAACVVVGFILGSLGDRRETLITIAPD